MSSVSIVIKAKSEAKAAFDRVKGDVKDLAEDTQKATSGMKAAHEAVAKAMRGDLVGAAQSAASAFKALWAVVISNPIAALVAVVAAAAVGMFKLYQAHKEAEKEAKEHAEAVNELRKELDSLTSPSMIDRVKEQAKAMAGSGDEMGLRKRIQDIREYAAALAGLADKKLADIGQMTDKDEIEAAKKEYAEIISKLKDLKAYEKEYAGALADVRAEHAKVAAAEKAASEQALANKAALIKAEREMQQELDATLNEYERQLGAREAAAAGDIAAFEKMVSRRKELEGATDAVTKAEIERKHILEDIAEMQSGESVNTLEYMKKQEELRLKEVEIANIKDAAAKKTAQESIDRLKGANDVLAVEEKIKKVKEPDAWDNNGWRAKDPRKGIRDPWDDLKNKKPEFPPPIPPMPQNPNAPGQPGGAAAADPWSAKLDAIKTSVDNLRGDLTGGGVA